VVTDVAMDADVKARALVSRRILPRQRRVRYSSLRLARYDHRFLTHMSAATSSPSKAKTRSSPLPTPNQCASQLALATRSKSTTRTKGLAPSRSVRMSRLWLLDHSLMRRARVRNCKF
jgi:hypothetical protein